MSKVKEVGLSFLDGMWFATYTLGPTMIFLWAIGFIQINLEGKEKNAKKRIYRTLGMECLGQG